MKAHLSTARATGSARIGLLAAGVVTTAALFAAQSASAASTTIYNNVPSPLPGNVVSVPFAAKQAAEFGGQIGFAGTAREHAKVRVTMSSWGCESGRWDTGNCSTTKGATFSHPITLKVYAVGPGNEPGTLLASITRTFDIPFRPSADFTHCTGVNAGRWFDRSTGVCYRGKATNLTFATGGLQLPNKAIVSIAFNTTHNGYAPVGESAPCFGSDGGCGYDALNVGVGNSPPAVGSQPLPNDAYFNSTSAAQYCDNGAGGTGVFRLDTGCWGGMQPAFRVNAR